LDATRSGATLPALHVLLESLDRTCATHEPRRVFSVTLPRSRIASREAREVAAMLFMQAVVGDVVLEVRTECTLNVY
jgi:hypothetical protein